MTSPDPVHGYLSDYDMEIPDGCGCAELWELLSEARQRAETIDQEQDQNQDQFVDGTEADPDE